MRAVAPRGQRLANIYPRLLTCGESSTLCRWQVFETRLTQQGSQLGLAYHLLRHHMMTLRQ